MTGFKIGVSKMSSWTCFRI